MCNECGVAYSFLFGVQYHKADCPVVAGEDVVVLTKAENCTANPMTKEAFLARDHGKS